VDSSLHPYAKTWDPKNAKDFRLQKHFFPSCLITWTHSSCVQPSTFVYIWSSLSLHHSLSLLLSFSLYLSLSFFLSVILSLSISLSLSDL
jgi:hypothetical protein